MNKLPDTLYFTIVHIEDEANNWRALPRAIRNAIYDRLDSAARTSLLYRPPEPRGSYPAKSLISWKRDGNAYEIQYWLLENATLTQISDQFRGSPTFIVDVMRPDQVGALQSGLATSINSIAPHVTSWEAQVRVFTAFGIPESDPVRPLELIKKSETTRMVEFLMQRVGMA